jgi:hypothetical protein
MQSTAVIEATFADTGQIPLGWCVKGVYVTFDSL